MRLEKKGLKLNSIPKTEQKKTEKKIKAKKEMATMSNKKNLMKRIRISVC